MYSSMHEATYETIVSYASQSTLSPPKLTLWNVIYNHKVVTASDVYAHSGPVV